MKEVVKQSRKSKLFLTFLFNIVNSLSSYGISFAFALCATDPLTLDKMNLLFVVLVILFVIYLFSQYGYYYNAEVFYYQLQIDTEKNYFNKLSRMSVKRINEYNTGYITDLIKEHALNTTLIVSDIAEVYVPLVIGLGSFLYVAFRQSVYIGLICLFLFIMITAIRYFMNKRKKKYIKKFYDSQAKYKGVLIDFISNIKTVIKLNSTRFAQGKIGLAKDKCIDDQQKCCNCEAKIQTVFDGMTNSLYIIVLLLALYNLTNGVNVLAYLMFYITMIDKVVASLKNAAKAIGRVLNYSITKRQLDFVIGDLEDIKYVNKFKKYEIVNGEFSYPNSNIKISIPKLEISNKDKVCIVGESGQGKSTLLNILIGVLKLDSGNILIDNKETKDLTINSVFVSQEIEVFNMTIRDNLLLGKDVPENKVLNVFDDAGLLEWYYSLPNGLDEYIGEKGVKVSVGQKQRLNIIRGLLNDSNLYIFDEPTSNLDAESEEKITYLIEKYLKDKAFVIVTHRDKLKGICNKCYSISNHTLKEVE